MAKRSGFTDDDYQVMVETINKRIETESLSDGNGQGPIIDVLAPLFRVREKVLGAIGRGSKSPAPKQARATTNRTPRTTTTSTQPPAVD